MYFCIERLVAGPQVQEAGDRDAADRHNRHQTRSTRARTRRFPIHHSIPRLGARCPERGRDPALCALVSFHALLCTGSAVPGSLTSNAHIRSRISRYILCQPSNCQLSVVRYNVIGARAVVAYGVRVSMLPGPEVGPSSIPRRVRAACTSKCWWDSIPAAPWS